MCSPAIFLAAGTAVSAYGQIQQGQTQQAIANRNATVLNYQASDAAVRGSQEEQIQRQKVQQLLGAQTAAAGASGADVGSKSFGDVMATSAAMGELDAQQIRMNAMREAWGFKTQAEGLQWQGQAAKQAGLVGGIGTAITGFGAAYGSLAKTGTTAASSSKLYQGGYGALLGFHI